MKKVVGVFLTFMLLLSLVACADEGQSPALPALTPQIAGYEMYGYGLLNTPAEENGMGDSLIYFRGTGTKIELKGETYLLHIETEDGGWVMGFADSRYADPAIIATAGLVGQEADFYVTYLGFSELVQLPACFLGEEDSMILLETGTTYNFNSFIDPALLTEDEEEEEEEKLEDQPPVKTQPLIADVLGEELYKLNKDMKYAEIVDLVELFLFENDVPADDIAYEILEMATELTGLVAKCTINVDSFDNRVTVYFSGVEAISSSINVVPYLDNNQACVTLGFVKSGWLFFDQITLKIGEDKFDSTNLDYFSVNRDIISGDTIMEYYDTSLSWLKFVEMLSYDTPVIRFTCRDDKSTLDHTLTEAEIDAVYTIDTLRAMNRTLSDIFYRWV